MVTTTGPPRPEGSLRPMPGRRRWLWPQGGASSRSAQRPSGTAKASTHPALLSLRSGPFHPVAVPAPCPRPASTARLRIQRPRPGPRPGPREHRPFAFAAARSTPDSGSRWSRSPSLHSLSRNCHADRPLAGVHRGPPAHAIPRKVTQTPELRRPPRSIPGGTGLGPARCRRPWKLL